MPGVQQPLATATIIGEVPSQATQFSAQPFDPRGDSLFAGAERPGQSSQNRIQIVQEGQPSRVYAVAKTAITIGRGNDNDIVLIDNQLSRHHARIDCSGSQYRVTDLNSTNGTYLENARLLPGIAEEWLLEKILRVGGTALRMLPGVPPDEHTEQRRRDGQGAGASPARSTSAPPAPAGVEEGRIAILTDNNAIALVPGQMTSLAVTLLNQGSVVDHFQVSLEGIPSAWLPTPTPLIQLMPGARQVVTMAIQPPRTPQARAGRYPVTVRASSRDNPNQTAESSLTATVAPFSHFSTEMHPQRLRAGKVGRVTVRNMGNIQETFQITYKDRADELTFQPPVIPLRVPEGQTAEVDFRSLPRQRKLVGGETSHSFTALIAGAQGEPQIQTGELISRALIPGWVIPLLGMLVVLLIAGAGLVYNNSVNQNRQATETDLAMRTEVAIIVAGTAQAATAASDQGTAQVNTQQAETQNALLQIAEDQSKTEIAAVIQTSTQAAIDAQNAQNAQTTTALANAQLSFEALQAEQTALALTQTAAYQLTSAYATTQAAQMITTQAADSALKDMEFFTGYWINTNASPESGDLVRLSITKVDGETVTLQGYTQCDPDNCDLGEIEIPFTPPTLTGKFNSSGKRILLNSYEVVITKNVDGKNLDVTMNVNNSLTRTKKTYYYTFKPTLILNLPRKP